MQITIVPHRFDGTVRIPGSKSHTIRRLLIAALADGISEIDHPLDSLDTRSCISVCRTLGAEIDEKAPALCTVKGRGSKQYQSAEKCLTPLYCNVGNSGTTLYLALAIAALGENPAVFDGDESIRRRSAAPLLDALKDLGAKIESAPNGCAPVKIQGPWKGGRVSVSCTTSQYLSPLLIAAPLASPGTITEIDVPLLNEKPYIEMTLSYLKAQHIHYETKEDFSFFRIPGGANYKPVSGPVPGDFSSAAFLAAAAAISGGIVTLLGLDPNDTQGDKEFFASLKKMGCTVTETAAGFITVSRDGPLKAGEFDLNATPDLLPVMAVTACYAEGDTRLYNAAHARIKETDRIAVMTSELGKLGVHVQELSDGLIVCGKSFLGGGKVDSRGDHRIAMALAVGALGAEHPVEISGAECADISYPGFLELITKN